MPTSRKRIGFLPTEEVQNIIDKISLRNNLSQSKVTGILVEEALKSRNLLKQKIKAGVREIDLNYDLYKSKISNNIDNFTLNSKDIEDDKKNEEYKEYNLIKEYLNYKNFKKILAKVQSE